MLVEEGYNVLKWRYVNKEVAVLGLWRAKLDSNINSVKKPSKQNLQLISGADPPQACRAAERDAFLGDARVFPAVGRMGHTLRGDVLSQGCEQV